MQRLGRWKKEGAFEYQSGGFLGGFFVWRRLFNREKRFLFLTWYVFSNVGAIRQNHAHRNVQSIILSESRIGVCNLSGSKQSTTGDTDLPLLMSNPQTGIDD